MDKMTYEEAIQRLEIIIQKLESNEIPLEDSLSLFQEGVELSHFCHSKLENIQKKVAQIYENDHLEDFKAGE